MFYFRICFILLLRDPVFLTNTTVVDKDKFPRPSGKPKYDGFVKKYILMVEPDGKL
jgi:hypothetical protein